VLCPNRVICAVLMRVAGGPAAPGDGRGRNGARFCKWVFATFRCLTSGAARGPTVARRQVRLAELSVYDGRGAVKTWRWWCSRRTMPDRRHVARMAGVLEVITHATGRGILALLWAWRSGANRLVRQALRHVSGPFAAGEGLSCRRT